MSSAFAAGVKGRRSRVLVVKAAKGMVNWGVSRRQGVIPTRLLGDMVNVIAYERRK